MPHRIARIRAGRHPHEVMVCAVAITIGVLGLVTPDFSPGIHATFDPPWRTVFYLALLVGGAVTMFGIVRHKVTGMLIERAGLAVLGTAFLVYGGMIVLVAGRSFAFALVPLAFAITTFWRGVQIGQDLQLLKEYLHDHPGPTRRAHPDDVD